MSAIDRPDQFLSSVNHLLFENTSLSSYATLFFAIYDGTNGQLLWANCGHLPGLIVRADGTVERLGATSTVIGLFEAWSCSIRESSLGPGDTFALYTDGVTESPNALEEEFGEDRLVSALRSHSMKSACAIAKAIVNDVEHFGASEQFDDITLIIARNVG